MKAGKIIVLPEAIANRIAAGEIIERPASVVRELLDNAVDASADRIEVDIEGGGLSMMRVSDNGHGFEPDGLLLAFERHATSKIRSLEDLDAIRTLGFRGEALPSIASVARVVVESFAPEHPIGARLIIDGGKIVSMESTSCAPGSRITVRNLFFNTPARRKFMKSTTTEYSHIHDTIIDHALAHMHIHFIFRDAGKTVLDSPSVDIWSARIAALFGKKFIADMLPVENVHPDIRIRGMICCPDHL
ncbi:ATP-binding protein, partial [bacterium]|nr:ATP-binding protein [candidate division CSSED10-310 bacterium]